MKLATVKRMYHELNAECFDGRLTPAVLRFTRSNKLHGKLRGNRKPVIMVSPFEGGERKMRATLFHEMVHQFLDWTVEAEDNGHHGDLFWLTYYTRANNTFDWEKPYND